VRGEQGGRGDSHGSGSSINGAVVASSGRCGATAAPTHPRTHTPTPGHGGWLRRTPFADLSTALMLYDCVGSANETTLRACRLSSQRLPLSPRDSARGVIVIMAQAYAVGGSQPGSTSSRAPRAPRAPLTHALSTTARSTLAQQGTGGSDIRCWPRCRRERW
jgi:hypothetical protein